MKYLKIHSLEKGWRDRNSIMLHAAFQILVDFVELEEPGKIVDWNSDDAHKEAWHEICDLYGWWTKKRPNRKYPTEDKRLKIPPFEFEDIPGSDCKRMIEPDKKKYAAYYKALEKQGQLEIEYHEEDQKNLHRLIEVRPYFWT